VRLHARLHAPATGLATLLLPISPTPPPPFLVLQLEEEEDGEDDMAGGSEDDEEQGNNRVAGGAGKRLQFSDLQVRARCVVSLLGAHPPSRAKAAWWPGARASGCGALVGVG